MNISRRYVDDIFTIGVLVLSTGACQTLLIDNSSSKAGLEGTPLLQGMWSCIYVLVAVRAASRYRSIVDAICANKPLAALVLLAVLSTVWSEDHGVTLRRSIALMATTLFGVDFAVRYSLRDQLRLLVIALGSVVALSVILQVFFPGLIPTYDLAYPDAWVGVFGQKNGFSKIVVLTAIVILASVRSSLGGMLAAICAVVAAFGLILAAQSMTSFVVFLVLLAVLIFAPTLRWSKGIRIAIQAFAGLSVVPFLLLVVRYRDAITNMLGRSSSLTGRLKIWTLAISCVAVKPLLGYGYNAFWNVSPESLRIDAVMNWNVPHAHNAYLELALELGLLGVALYAATYLLGLYRASEYMRIERGNSTKWPLAYLSFVLMYSFTESTVLAPNTIYWMLFVAAQCSVVMIEEEAEEPEATEDEVEDGAIADRSMTAA
jgi:exopolysaccharide production protein ExoQ